MTSLVTHPNLRDHDGIYARLVALQEGLDTEASLAAFARLILLLVNHIGDEAVIAEAVALAREAEKR